MLFGSTKVIGLDIGTSFIKLAEVDVSRKAATLTSFGIVPTPKGAISSRGEITDIASVAQVIQNLVKDVKSKRKHVATAMWGSAVMVKKITGPRMSEQDLAANIRFEAEQYIPFDVNEINLDFAILKNKNQSAETMDYLLIAAQREYLFKIAEVVETAGLQCSVVDVAGFSLANTYQFNYGAGDGQIISLANFGAGVTNFVVIENGDITFSRDIPSGGMNVTNEIHKNMGVSVDEAEALKISFSTGQNAPAEVGGIVKTAVSGLVDEVRRAVDFYAASAGDAAIQRLLISGGSSYLPGLTEGLTESLGFPVERFNPFQKIGYKSKVMTPEYIGQIAPYATVALGLALRGVNDR